MHRFLVAAVLVTAAGCGDESAQLGTSLTTALTSLTSDGPAPTEQLFVPVPRGMSPSSSADFLAAFTEHTATLPTGTRVTVFLGDSGELVTAFDVPKGGTQLRMQRLHRCLAPVRERLDPENATASQKIDLIAMPQTVRGYSNGLPARIVAAGSVLFEDAERGCSMTLEELPCDGVATAPETSWGGMASFPVGTRLSFFVGRADWGAGPSYRSEASYFIRYLSAVKGATVERITTDAELAFSREPGQWEVEATEPRDNCTGSRRIFGDDPPVEVFDRTGKHRITQVGTETIIERGPDVDALQGELESLVLLIDVSASVFVDSDGNDLSHIFNTIIEDACEKLETMPLRRFAIVGFGGAKDNEPRVVVHPRDFWGELTWCEATPEARSVAVQWVRGLEAGGGTPTYAALSAAAELPGPVSVICYTDGIPSLGPDQSGVLTFAEELAERGVVVNTVGVGPLSARSEAFDWTGAEFLAKVSHTTGGVYTCLDTDQKAVTP